VPAASEFAAVFALLTLVEAFAEKQKQIKLLV
jgi:hypothetical protein